MFITVEEYVTIVINNLNKNRKNRIMQISAGSSIHTRYEPHPPTRISTSPRLLRRINRLRKINPSETLFILLESL
jgi:hypothetical protein